MPRKTRKEKVAAKTHKQHTNQGMPKIVVPLSSPQVKPTVVTKKSPFAANDMTKEHFVTDLRKSLIIVFLILFVEFALYFLNLSGMLTIVNF